MEIKNYSDYIKEDLDTSVDKMKSASDTYNRYKSRVVSIVNQDDLEKASEDFNSFIDSLNDDEKNASDLLRSLYSTEILSKKIENLEMKKQEIEEEIKLRSDELKEMQDKLN